MASPLCRGGRWWGRVGLALQARPWGGPPGRRGRATLVSGHDVAQRLLAGLRERVSRLETIGIQPCLVPVVVGSNLQSEIYLKKKMEAAQAIGLRMRVQRVEADIGAIELVALLDHLNRDENVHAVIVQLPLPEGLNAVDVGNAITPGKDVDGFTQQNLGALVQSSETARLSTQNHVPCTALAVKKILEIGLAHLDLAGRQAVVVGRSLNVGLPIALVLESDRQNGGFDMTTTICHRNTVNLAAAVSRADLVVSAAGVPNLIRPEMVQPGAVVIDVGLNRIVNDEGQTRLVGDCHPDVVEVAGYMTPVPGGVGPCTVASLMHNSVLAAQRTAIRLSF